MKQLFVCEKCGTTFESYDEAEKCERFHVGIEHYTYNGILNPKMTWKHRQKMPISLVLASEPSYEWDEEQQKRVESPIRFGEYVLKRELRASEAKEIMDEYAEKQEQQRIEYEKYKAEREAKKNKEDAENA